MKYVLWVSRHEMTAEQFADLERVMGGPVSLLVWQETISDLTVLEPLLQKADAVAAVLPPEWLARLLRVTQARKIPLLQAVSQRQMTGRTILTHDGRSELEFAFVHSAWQEILRFEIETRTL